VLEALQKIRREAGTTVVLVTHDPDLAARMDRVIHLVDGQIAVANANNNAAQTLVGAAAVRP
jgi:ABC-type lipoprotein export system ATPase subunit